MATIPEILAQAVAHHQAGRRGMAEAMYRQVLSVDPLHPDAWHLLGVVAFEEGRPDEAIASISQAIQRKPNVAEFHVNLARVHRATRNFPEAVASCRRALQLSPFFAEGHNNLGNALKDSGDIAEAIASYRRAVLLKPAYATAHFNLGVALMDQRDWEAAEASFRRAIEIQPDFANAYANRGVTFFERGDFESAATNYSTAIQLDPNCAEAHYSLAVVKLLQGDWERGWNEYEWRWKYAGFTTPRRDFPQPQWRGESFSSKTLFLHFEQGYGDTIQFLRFVDDVARRGGSLIIECPEILLRLMKGNFPDHRWIAPRDVLPAFELHCPLMSLPLALGVRLEDIPKARLQADAADREAWRRRFDGGGPAFKIGIAWAGSKTHRNDHNRSTTLAHFAPLAAVPGVRLYSLQKGEAAEQIPEASFPIIDLGNDLHDFADTAAAIAELDLVVSVDTSVVHLAGALNRPVWTMLPYRPDWRWMLDRDDSPWYPSMRLFRQKAPGDWAAVFSRVAEALRTEGVI